MATLSYNDGNGVTWRVWDVIPGHHAEVSARGPGYLPDEMAGGWLCFQSRIGKRRLYPIPARWPSLSWAELDGLCRAAAPVPAASRAARAWEDGGCAYTPTG